MPLFLKFISIKRGTNSDGAISEAIPVSTQSFLCCSPDGGPPDYIVGLFIYSVVLVQLLMDTAMLFEKLLETIDNCNVTPRTRFPVPEVQPI